MKKIYKIVIKEVMFVTANDKEEAEEKALDDRMLVCDRKVVSIKLSNKDKLFSFIYK